MNADAIRYIWHKAGKRHGFSSLEEVKRWAYAGRLSANDIVYDAQEETYARAADLAGLSGCFSIVGGLAELTPDDEASAAGESIAAHAATPVVYQARRQDDVEPSRLRAMAGMAADAVAAFVDNVNPFRRRRAPIKPNARAARVARRRGLAEMDTIYATSGERIDVRRPDDAPNPADRKTAAPRFHSAPNWNWLPTLEAPRWPASTRAALVAFGLLIAALGGFYLGTLAANPPQECAFAALEEPALHWWEHR